MRADSSKGGLLTTDRPLAENPNPGEKFESQATPVGAAAHDRQADAQVDGALVAVVHTGADKCRRRVSFTLAAAERAVRRAEDAGHPATVVLCRLEPLGVVA